MAAAEPKPDMGTAVRIYNYMFPRMRDLQTEEFHILLMNQNYRLIKSVRISQGGITETCADIRVMMREAVLSNATILAAVHNHPSGCLTPSKCDDTLTMAIKKACELMRIHFLDHVIVTDGAYFSYHEMGKLYGFSILFLVGSVAPYGSHPRGSSRWSLARKEVSPMVTYSFPFWLGRTGVPRKP